MKILKSLSPNCFKGRFNWKPDVIVNHITEGSYSGSVSWLKNPSSGASAHFVISINGDVTQLAELFDGTWANGTGTDPKGARYYKNALSKVIQERATNANYYTYSIEFEGYSTKDRFGALTESQYQAGLEVMKIIIQDMKKTYGVDFIPDRDHFIGHYQVDPKGKPNCPAPNHGANFPFSRFLNDITAWLNKSNTNTTPTEGKTKISGNAVATVEQMTAYIKSKNANVPQKVLDMIPLYISEGKTEDIRGDVAFAQSCIETGNFTFTGGTAMTLNDNNFCGLGCTSLGVKGNIFSTSTIGIRAQIQHLKGYSNKDAIKGFIVDPRFQHVERGCAEYVEWLGQKENPKGKGWASGANYGKNIMTVLNAIINTKVTDTTTASFVVKILKDPVGVFSKVGSEVPVSYIRDMGSYTIVETQLYGNKLWGKLKSGAGWIDLSTTNYTASTPAATIIKNGSTVKLKQGAKTFTNGVINDFVFKETWIVKGDPREDGRAVIDKSVDGRYSIMTPVNIKDITLV